MNGGHRPRYRPKEPQPPKEEGSCALFFLLEAPIHCLDKHIRRPGTRSRTVTPVKVERGTGGPDLVERHTFVNHVLNAVANHYEHIAIRSHVAGIRKSSMTGNNPGAALRSILGHRQIKNVIEPFDDTLNAATLRQINHW